MLNSVVSSALKAAKSVAQWQVLSKRLLSTTTPMSHAGIVADSASAAGDKIAFTSKVNEIDDGERRAWEKDASDSFQ